LSSLGGGGSSGRFLVCAEPGYPRLLAKTFPAGPRSLGATFAPGKAFRALPMTSGERKRGAAEAILKQLGIRKPT
jgi:hypothetical protein